MLIQSYVKFCYIPSGAVNIRGEGITVYIKRRGAQNKGLLRVRKEWVIVNVR